jgi:hypothetical protein
VRSHGPVPRLARERQQARVVILRSKLSCTTSHQRRVAGFRWRGASAAA